MEAPKPGKADAAHALVGGAVGAFPWGGSLVQAIYQLCLVPPFQRKSQAFLEDVAATLSRHSVRIETLVDDDRFHAAAMQAALVAGRTRDETKRKALRNAVVNVVLRTEDEVHEELFLAWAEALSPTHLLVLDVLDDPPEWFRRRARQCPELSAPDEVLTAATALGRELLAPIVGELRLHGLTALHEGAISSPLVPVDRTAYRRPMLERDRGDRRRTTETGRRFLVFLREPPTVAPDADPARHRVPQ